MTHIDIITITGFMNDDQLADHVARYRDQLKQEQGA